jgi:hypothetical protein
MLSAYFSCQGFVSIEFLPQRERHNSRFFTETVLPSVEESLSVAHPRRRANGIYLHIDDAKPHDPEILLSKTDEMRFIHLWQPLCQPNLAPCGSFLFEYRTETLEGSNFWHENDVILTVRQILSQILMKTLAVVMDDWICRLNRCIELDGDYVH